jgi:hypothetical protein
MEMQNRCSTANPILSLSEFSRGMTDPVLNGTKNRSNRQHAGWCPILKAELTISGEFRKEDLERLRNQTGRLIDNLDDAFLD